MTRKLKAEIWPEMITLYNMQEEKKYRECINWMIKKFGIHHDRWYVVNRTYYYFKTGEDATMFALRWL